eukprot:TRINITY_DN44326_c0_g1_i2.p1 TRINITY_DN44326_c0_g1~~TRINITY_DN44326_c0_g1_i2.p1  ORF type:complete len:932 (+),score=199.58 TRINITY_DN44326_c0_g1_i2:70-2865(+)
MATWAKPPPRRNIHGGAVSARDSSGKEIGGAPPMSVSQVMSKQLKDQEALCGQLMAYTKNVEEQLRALWADHQDLRAEASAMRRCLDRKGLLAQDELECELRQRQAAMPVQQQPVSRPPSVGRQLQSRCPSSSRRRSGSESGHLSSFSSLVPQGDFVASHGSLQSTSTTATPDSTWEPRELRPAIQMSSSIPPSPAGPEFAGMGVASSSASSSRGRSVDVHRSVSGLIPETGSGAVNRGVSAHAVLMQHRAQSPAQQRALSRRPHERQDRIPEGMGSPERRAHEFYDLVHGLLNDHHLSAVEQQRTLLSIQRILKHGQIGAWPGPVSALNLAVRAGRVDLARVLLLAKANANEKDEKGVSPLHLAAFDGNVGLCRVLLVARADVDSKDRHGQTPLFFAPSREVCKLLSEKKADLTLLNHKGQSALHLAGRAGLTEVLAWLAMRVEKNFLELKDIRGATARAYAQQAELRQFEAPLQGGHGGALLDGGLAYPPHSQADSLSGASTATNRALSPNGVFIPPLALSTLSAGGTPASSTFSASGSEGLPQSSPQHSQLGGSSAVVQAPSGHSQEAGRATGSSYRQPAGGRSSQPGTRGRQGQAGRRSPERVRHPGHELQSLSHQAHSREAPRNGYSNSGGRGQGQLVAAPPAASLKRGGGSASAPTLGLRHARASMSPPPTLHEEDEEALCSGSSTYREGDGLGSPPTIVVQDAFRDASEGGGFAAAGLLSKTSSPFSPESPSQKSSGSGAGKAAGSYMRTPFVPSELSKGSAESPGPSSASGTPSSLAFPEFPAAGVLPSADMLEPAALLAAAAVTTATAQLDSILRQEHASSPQLHATDVAAGGSPGLASSSFSVPASDPIWSGATRRSLGGMAGDGGAVGELCSRLQSDGMTDVSEDYAGMHSSEPSQPSQAEDRSTTLLAEDGTLDLDEAW